MKTKEYKYIEYKYIEYTNDDDLVIANVVMDGDKIVRAKLVEASLTNLTKFQDLKAFINIITPMPWKYDETVQECVDWYEVPTQS